jgi:hypothetical protein
MRDGLAPAGGGFRTLADVAGNHSASQPGQLCRADVAEFIDGLAGGQFHRGDNTDGEIMPDQS